MVERSPEVLANDEKKPPPPPPISTRYSVDSSGKGRGGGNGVPLTQKLRALLSEEDPQPSKSFSLKPGVGLNIIAQLRSAPIQC